MPLEIILQAQTTNFYDMQGNVIGGSIILADFGPLIVTSTSASPEAKLDPKIYPFTVTHRQLGMAVDHFMLFDLCCCAARQWAEFDWNFPNYPHFPADSQTQRRRVYEAMKKTAIAAFGFRSKNPM